MSIGERLAIFRPHRWARIREGDRLGFALRIGVPVGVVLATIVDSLMLWLSGDGDLLLSVWRLPRLALSIATLGTFFGAAAARLVWSRGEDAYAAHRLKEAFRANPVALAEPRPAEPAPDAAERR